LASGTTGANGTASGTANATASGIEWTATGNERLERRRDWTTPGTTATTGTTGTTSTTGLE